MIQKSLNLIGQETEDEEVLTQNFIVQRLSQETDETLLGKNAKTFCQALSFLFLNESPRTMDTVFDGDKVWEIQRNDSYVEENQRMLKYVSKKLGILVPLETLDYHESWWDYEFTFSHLQSYFFQQYQQCETKMPKMPSLESIVQLHQNYSCKVSIWLLPNF